MKNLEKYTCHLNIDKSFYILLDPKGKEVFKIARDELHELDLFTADASNVLNLLLTAYEIIEQPATRAYPR